MRLRMVELKNMVVPAGTKEARTLEAYENGWKDGVVFCVGIAIVVVLLIRLGGWVFGCF